jgi:subtilisin family serine protease
MHVDVISLSLGSDSDDPYLDAQIDYALSKGIAVVAAAGNGGCDCMVYPAALPEVVGVGASDQSDLRASFSSYGSSLDLLAPGTAMCSTLWSAANQTSGYGCGGQGTSFATPLVSGAIVAALTAGAASTDLAIQSVMASADKVSSMASNSRTDLYGVGRLDLSEALTAAASKHYSISADLAMRFHCPGDVHTCSYAIGDQFGATVVISAKAPVTAGGEYVYLLPNGDNTTPGIKSLQPFGSAIHQPRIYVTFDP